jgi:hypothetical protein
MYCFVFGTLPGTHRNGRQEESWLGPGGSCFRKFYTLIPSNHPSLSFSGADLREITLFFLSLSQSNLARIAALPDPESINSFHSSFALGKIKLAAIRKDVAAVD